MSFTISNTPSPDAFQRPYLAAGHAPLHAEPGTYPALPVPASRIGADGERRTHIEGQPAGRFDDVSEVPIPVTSDVHTMSSLAPPVDPYVQHLDLATPASRSQMAALTARTPVTGIPARPAAPFIAPTNARSSARPS